jgi:hypothetical protein
VKLAVACRRRPRVHERHAELIVVARDAFAKAFREVISKGGNVRVEYLLNQIGLALRDHIASVRFEGQSEVPLRPLSRAWQIRKAREGRDPAHWHLHRRAAESDSPLTVSNSQGAMMEFNGRISLDGWRRVSLDRDPRGLR